MKKINLITLFLIIAYSINAQNYFAAPKAKSNKIQSNNQSKSVYLFEDFNEGFPSNWELINEGDDDYTWYIRTHESYNFDGTPYLWIDSDEAGPGVLVEETMTTNEVNTEGATNLLLAFDQRFNTLGNTNATVEIWNGTQWILVLDNGEESGLVGNWGDPDKVMIDITQHANSAMKVKFYFSTTFEWGWAIDNVKIYQPDFETDLALTNVLPQSFLRKDSLYNPQISVYNAGVTEITEFTANYQVWDSNENLISELSANVSGVDIQPNSNFSFTYSETFSLPDSGIYNFQASISYPNQENEENNTIEGNLQAFKEYNSFAINSGSDKLESILAPFGNSEIIGDIEAYMDFPMAMDFTKENLLLLRGSRQLSEIDTLTGTETVLGTISAGDGTLSGLAYNPDQDTYYVSIIAETNDASFIYELDINTLSTSLIGQFTDGQIIAIDYGTDGYIYGIDLLDDKLWRFNLSSSEGEEVGDVGQNMNFGQDITYNVMDNKIYGMLYYSGEYSSFLNIIDTQTGQGTQIFDANGLQYSTFAMTLKGGTAQFYVHDNQSNPIENVMIEFQNMTFTTDEFGELVKFLPQREYSFSATKTGYDTYSSTFTTTNNQTVDIDIELTQIVSIEEQSTEISIYPNPTNGVITLTGFETLSELKSLTITDITGKQMHAVETQSIASSQQVDISNFPNGIYFIKIKTEAEIYTQKIVKY